MRSDERRIENLEKQVLSQQKTVRWSDLTEADLEQCRRITSAYVERFGNRYLHSDLLPEPVGASPEEVAKVVVRNSCQVVKALIILRHWERDGINSEPEDTWPEVLRDMNTELERGA